jgi:hypothetical protein
MCQCYRCVSATEDSFLFFVRSTWLLVAVQVQASSQQSQTQQPRVTLTSCFTAISLVSHSQAASQQSQTQQPRVTRTCHPFHLAPAPHSCAAHSTLLHHYALLRFLNTSLQLQLHTHVCCPFHLAPAPHSADASYTGRPCTTQTMRHKQCWRALHAPLRATQVLITLTLCHYRTSETHACVIFFPGVC